MTGPAKSRTELLDRRYRLVEPVGRGGMSVVWRGYDEVLGRQVAVKVLNVRLADDPVLRQRIRSEAQAAARLCHPHITNVYDYGESRRRGGGVVPYVVMELVHGESMAARLRRAGTLPWREAVVITAEVAAALAAAHARGVVHRDVTPGNVMLTPAGAKVVDFGISAVAGEADRGADGPLLGTPAYLAPERMEMGRVTPASDVYALGLLLYRALTGRLPWNAPTTTQLLRAHRYAEPEPMPPVPGLPGEVAELGQRCLAKSPHARPTSADVARVLSAAVGVAIAPVSPAPTGAVDSEGDTEAGTTILPWSAGAHAMTVGRRRRPDDRLRFAAAAVAVAAMVGLVWGVTAQTSSSAETAERPRPIGMAAEPAPNCQVTYALRADSGRDFRADLTLVNRAPTAVRQWALTFAYPEGQRITAFRSAQVNQMGREVVIRPATAAEGLAPGGTVRVSLDGTHNGYNALPVRFNLDGARCDAEVSGVAAATSAPPVTQKPPAAQNPVARPAVEPGKERSDVKADERAARGHQKGKKKDR